jgi:hypothetical protein
MSERRQQMYVTSVSSDTVVLSPHPVDPPSKAGLGIQQVTIRTTESTGDGTFYGVTGSCGNFIVIIRKVD